MSNPASYQLPDNFDPPNPPDEPEQGVEDDNEYLSTCCSANRLMHTDICSWCGEHATFENEVGEVEE